MSREEINKKISYILDEIDRLKSTIISNKTLIEKNTIESKVNKHKWEYDYSILFNDMIDDEESLLINSKYNISGKCKDEE